MLIMDRYGGTYDRGVVPTSYDSRGEVGKAQVSEAANGEHRWLLSLLGALLRNITFGARRCCERKG